MSSTELDCLAALSARIGRNGLLTQGSSGNTSLKDGKVLWVKASGTWLAEAERTDVFVPVHWPQVRQRLWSGAPIGPDCVLEGHRTLQPSIETAMHAVLPDRIVLHVHSVSAIAGAVRGDAALYLARFLDPLPWRFVPYVCSGTPLALAIHEVLLEAPHTRIFVLGNHGLIVCGRTCNEADELLALVESRLPLVRRQAPACDEKGLTRAACGSSHVLPADERVHSLATDPVARRILASGVLYPCQSIFLGGSRPWQDCGFQGSKSFAVFPGKGVLVRRDICSGDYEALLGLAEVVQRIDAAAPLRYLTPEETSSAEGCTHYREAANRQPSARFA